MAFRPGLHHLHRLVAGDGAQGAHKGIGVQHMPQPFGAHAGNRVLDHETAAQAQHLLRRVGAGDAGPARGFRPILASSARQGFARTWSAFLLVTKNHDTNSVDNLDTQ
jgi:hypothetical protein